MSARRLAVLVDHLPPEAMAVRLAMAEHEGLDSTSSASSNGSARVLEDIPVVSLRDARNFIQSSGDEFANRFADAG